MEKKPEDAELFKKAGVTGKISDIKGTVRFEQANENANVTVSFEKFEGITKKHGLHIHTFSNFQASGKHLGGKKIPYNDVNILFSLLTNHLDSLSCGRGRGGTFGEVSYNMQLQAIHLHFPQNWTAWGGVIFWNLTKF